MFVITILHCQSDFENAEDIKENLGNAMADLALDDDDDGEAAVMEDSDLENEEDEVAITFLLLPHLCF